MKSPFLHNYVQMANRYLFIDIIITEFLPLVQEVKASIQLKSYEKLPFLFYGRCKT